MYITTTHFCVHACCLKTNNIVMKAVFLMFRPITHYNYFCYECFCALVVSCLSVFETKVNLMFAKIPKPETIKAQKHQTEEN